MGAFEDAYLQRRQGERPNGTVSIRDFDIGVMKALVGEYQQIDVTDGSGKIPIGVYVKGIPDACPANGLPGIPIVFADPDDTIKVETYPYILVRRDDFSAAKERWQPSGLQYRGPGEGAIPKTVSLPNGTVLSGFDRMEVRAQAEPYDIMYTISVKARFRGSTQRNNANALLMHVLKVFPPYGKIAVTDSLQDFRGYDAFNEGITSLDELTDIQNRVIGNAITLRVEGELDLRPSETYRTVTAPLKPRINRF